MMTELVAAGDGEVARRIAAGHSFVVLLRDGFPVNVLNQLKLVPEVCTIFCATANPAAVVRCRARERAAGSWA